MMLDNDDWDQLHNLSLYSDNAWANAIDLSNADDSRLAKKDFEACCHRWGCAFMALRAGDKNAAIRLLKKAATYSNVWGCGLHERDAIALLTREDEPK